MAAADYVTVVQQLYVSYFGRPADTSGLASFTAALDTTGVPATIAGVNAAYASNPTVKALVDSFAASAESAALYGSGTTESFVFAIYDHVLNRVPDADGFTFWVNAINNGTLSRGNAALQIMNGALNNTSTQGQADAALVNARIQVATNFTDAITTENATFSGDAAAASARTMLDTVTGSTDVTAFQSTIVSTLTAITYPDVGSTFTLTTAATGDTFVGTAKDDTFNATTLNTLQAGDKIIDGSTTDHDVLNAKMSAGAAATITNVETVNVDWDSIGNAAFDATNVTGATINLSSAKFGFAGSATVTALGANNFVAGSGLTGTVTVNGITKGSVDAGSAIKAVVTGSAATTDASTLTVNKATFTVDNDASLEQLTLKATVDSTITIDSITDKLIVAGDKNVTVKSGAFTAETVTNSLTNGAKLTVEDTNSGATDFTKVQADTYKISAGTNGAAAKTFATGSNVYLNVDLGNSASAIASAAATASTNTMNITAAKDQTGLVLTNIATANITAAATAATGDAANIDLTFAVLDAGTNAVVLGGTDDVKVTSGTAKTFDASGLVGLLDYTQAAAVDTTVKGGSGANKVTLVGTTHTMSYVGHDGGDTVTANALTSGSLSVELGNGNNTVTTAGGTADTTAATQIVIASGSGNDTITLTGVDSGTVSVQSGAGNDKISLTTLTDGQVALDLGSGDDTVTFGATTVTGVVAITGGDGTDTIKVDNGTNLSGATLSLSGIDVIQLITAGGTATFDASQLEGQNYTLKGTGAVTSGKFTDFITVTTAKAGSHDFSALTLASTLSDGIGGLHITGSSGNDTIVGTNGNDVIASNGGNDTITGGQGVDAMTGGAGVDTFVFAAGDSGKTATTVDSIASFTTTVDKIKIGLAGSATNYAEVDLNAAVAFNAAAAVAGAEGVFDGTVKFVYISNTNVGSSGSNADAFLVYDSNGDHTADMAIQIVGGKALSFFAYGDIIA